MPSRMVREGLLDSDPLRAAGELAEVLFTRLMLVADDYGRFDGRVTVICRRCWPLGGPSESDVEGRLSALVREGLVSLYQVGGKPFICIPKFNQRLRLKNPSKFPDPREIPSPDGRLSGECPSDGGQMMAEVKAKSEVKTEVHAPVQVAPLVPSTTARAGTLGAAGLAGLPQRLTLDEAKISGGEDTPAAHLASVLRANGVKGNHFHPLVVEWAQEGVTVEKLKEAIAKARQRPGKEKGTFGPEYLDPILHDETKPAAQVHAERASAGAARAVDKTQKLIAEQRARETAPMPEHLRPKVASA